jgi:hypothetical protein
MSKRDEGIISENSEALYDLDATLYALAKLWTPHSTSSNSYNYFTILDTLVLDGKNVVSWFFTTKDGEVKNRSSRNRTYPEISAKLFSDENSSSDCLSGHSRFIDTFISGSLLPSKEFPDKSKHFTKLNKFADFQRQLENEKSAKIILSRPPRLQNEEKYLKIVCVNGKIAIQNLKCFLLVDSSIKGYAVAPSEGNQSKKNERLQLPFKEVPCRNKIILEIAKDYSSRLLRILEFNALTGLKRKIQKIAFHVLLEDLSKELHSSSGATSSAPNFQLWLHSFEEIQFESSLFPIDDTLAACSEGNLSAISSFTSSASKKKINSNQVFQCPGDFCCYHPIDQASFLKNSSSAPRRTAAMNTANIMEMIFEDIDIKTESQNAIRRHKRDENEGYEDDDLKEGEEERQEQVEEEGADGDEMNHHQRSTSDDMSQDPEHSVTSQSISTQKKSIKSKSSSIILAKNEKKLKILFKSISLAREEMVKLEALEKKISHLFQPVNYQEVLEIKNVLLEIWPIEIAKYWFMEGKHHFIETRSKHQQPQSISSGSLFSQHSFQSRRHRSMSSDNLSISSNPSTVSSVVSQIGKLPSLLQEKMNLLNEFHDKFDESLLTKPYTAQPGQNNNHSDDTPVADDISDNKWFAIYYSQVHVCENCYQIYLQLDKNRDHRNLKLKRNKIQEQDSIMTAEEKLEKDREIEKKIFQQRKLMSKLSKSKSAPSSLQQQNSISSGIASLPQNSSIKGKSKSKKSLPRGGLLPPMPWQLAQPSLSTLSTHQEDDNYSQQSHQQQQAIQEAYFQNSSSIAKHMMNRNPVPIPNRPHESEDEKRKAEIAFEEMRRNLEKSQEYSFKPMIIEKKEVKPTVKAKDYNPEHLLHEWHRDMKRLRSLIHEKKSSAATAAGDDSVDQPPVSSLAEIAKKPLLGAGSSLSSSHLLGRDLSKTSIHEEEEEDDDQQLDDDEEVGESLGWNPYQIM